MNRHASSMNFKKQLSNANVSIKFNCTEQNGRDSSAEGRLFVRYIRQRYGLEQVDGKGGKLEKIKMEPASRF